MKKSNKRTREETDEEYSTKEEDEDNLKALKPAPLVHKSRKGLYDARVEAFLYGPLADTTEFDDDFKHNKILTPNSLKGKPLRDWKDNKLKGLVCYNLQKLEDIDIVKMGESFMSSLHIEMKQNVFSEMFLLAYNLKDPSGTPMLRSKNYDIVDIKKTVDTDFDISVIREIDGGIYQTMAFKLPKSRKRRLEHLDILRMMATAYSFLAASYIRLFAKNADNYNNIVGKDLAQRFNKFYTIPFPLNGYHPTRGAIELFKSQLELDYVAKNTLYAFLYASNKCPVGKNIKSYLYTNHLCYTGLHPVSLFLKTMRMYDVDPFSLEKALNTPRITETLKSLMNVVHRFILSKNRDYECEMWKFGRLFEPRFLSDLQTKYCKYFTLVLAYMTRTRDVPAHRDVLNIAHLQDISDENHRQAMMHAKKALLVIVEQKRITSKK